MKSIGFSRSRIKKVRVGAWLLFVLAFAGNGSAAEWTLRVDGMACPFCAYGIEKKLLETPGVEDLKILLDEGKIVLTLAQHSKLDVRALHSAIKKAGFTLHSILVDDAGGRLSRDARGDLELTIVDPSVTFEVTLEAPGVLSTDSQGWPREVFVTGTVTEYTSSTPKLVAREIISQAEEPVP